MEEENRNNIPAEDKNAKKSLLIVGSITISDQRAGEDYNDKLFHEYILCGYELCKKTECYITSNTVDVVNWYTGEIAILRFNKYVADDSQARICICPGNIIKLSEYCDKTAQQKHHFFRIIGTKCKKIHQTISKHGNSGGSDSRNEIRIYPEVGHDYIAEHIMHESKIALFCNTTGKKITEMHILGPDSEHPHRPRLNYKNDYMILYASRKFLLYRSHADSRGGKLYRRVMSGGNAHNKEIENIFPDLVFFAGYCNGKSGQFAFYCVGRGTCIVNTETGWVYLLDWGGNKSIFGCSGVADNSEEYNNSADPSAATYIYSVRFWKNYTEVLRVKVSDLRDVADQSNISEMFVSCGIMPTLILQSKMLTRSTKLLPFTDSRSFHFCRYYFTETRIYQIHKSGIVCICDTRDMDKVYSAGDNCGSGAAEPAEILQQDIRDHYTEITIPDSRELLGAKLVSDELFLLARVRGDSNIRGFVDSDKIGGVVFYDPVGSSDAEIYRVVV